MIWKDYFLPIIVLSLACMFLMLGGCASSSRRDDFFSGPINQAVVRELQSERR